MPMPIGVPDPRYMIRRAKRKAQMVTRPAHRPSFWARLQTRRQIWASLTSIHGPGDEVFPEYSKLRARDLALAAGVDTPRLLDGPVAAHDLDVASYGESFVVKPNWGRSSLGVLVVLRTSTSGYVDLVDGEELTLEALRVKAHDRVAASGRGRPDDLIVEESMATERTRPQEWKVWVFGSRIGLIQQNDRTTGAVRTRNFRGDWTPSGRIRPDRAEHPDLPEPHSRQQLLSAALRVAGEIPSGFVRVDLFESPTTLRPVLGEVCLIPGGDLYLSQGLDREFGEMWNRADIDLLANRMTLIP